ncbi:MAG: U32 family peptidase [Exilispira sp.]
MPELIAPAGSLESAIYAFNAGADAVYFGLTYFSARKYAINFNEAQYRKLLFYAKRNDKKVYLTLNTLVKEEEIPNLFNILNFLSIFPPDAIIIQDFGLIEIIRYFLKDIKIHASTQSGTFSHLSYQFLKNLEIKRVILARESTISDIMKIKKNFTDIEIEVFIHGALCYSFSGFCLASGILLKRSANKGECAQICRNRFVLDNATFFNNFDNNDNSAIKNRIDKNNQLNLTLFSCNDLNLGTKIIDLAEIGVNSFKIEGRMKDPVYTFNTVNYYRKILDKYREIKHKCFTKKEDFTDKEFIIEKDFQLQLENINKNIKLSFSRFNTKGYLYSSQGDKLINPFFPSHLGINLGKIIKIKKEYIQVKLGENLSRKDGILLLIKSKNKFIDFAFSASKLVVNEKEVIQAFENQIVKIYSEKLSEFYDKIYYRISRYINKVLSNENISNDINLDQLKINFIFKNDFIEIRKISDRNLDLKKLNENNFEEIKFKVRLNINFEYSENENLKKDNFVKSFNYDKIFIILKYRYRIYDQTYQEIINFEAFKKTGNLFFSQILIEKLKKSSKEDYFEIEPFIEPDSNKIINIIFVKPSITNKIVTEIKNNIRLNLKKFLNQFNIDQFNNNFKYFEENFKNIFDSIFNRIESRYIDYIIKNNYKDQSGKAVNQIHRIKNNNEKTFNKNHEIKNQINKILRDEKIIYNGFFNRKIISPFNSINSTNNIENNKFNFINFFEDTKILPFVIFENLKETDIDKNKTISKFSNIVFLPLHPVILDQTLYIEKIDEIINSNDKYIYIIGINASWHFFLYEKYLLKENIFFFYDFYIYISNSISYIYYSNFDKFLFGFYSIEFQDKLQIEKINDNLNLYKVINFNPPLFISRICIQKNILNDSVCLKNCIKNFSYPLMNQKNRFLYIVAECISYLFKIN